MLLTCHVTQLQHNAQANPPFVANIVEAMAQRMDFLLKRSVSQSEGSGGGGVKALTSALAKSKAGQKKLKAQRARMKPLSFVVVIPHCDVAASTRAVQQAAGPGWEALRHSPFLTKHLRFKAQDHGYIEGSQHQRPTRYKTSRFDSSLFVLQNDAARAKWPLTSEVCCELRSAFESRFEAELESRRGGGGGGRGGPGGVALASRSEGSGGGRGTAAHSSTSAPSQPPKKKKRAKKRREVESSVRLS